MKRVTTPREPPVVIPVVVVAVHVHIALAVVPVEGRVALCENSSKTLSAKKSADCIVFSIIMP